MVDSQRLGKMSVGLVEDIVYWCCSLVHVLMFVNMCVKEEKEGILTVYYFKRLKNWEKTFV